MKKKLVSVVGAMLLSMWMIVPVMAAGGGVVPVLEGTDVYAGVVVDDETTTDARIRVTVPTLFAFVVNGSKTETAALSSTDGSILLPNVKVTVDGAKTGIEVVGDSVMTFTNYSTKLNGGAREGIPVNLTGSIENKGTENSRGGWTHIGTTPAGTKDNDVKKFQLSVDKKIFNTVLGDGVLGMATAATLPAPVISAANPADTTTQLATSGAKSDLAFDVAVGGTRENYQTVEKSAKVGTIVWTVGYTN